MTRLKPIYAAAIVPLLAAAFMVMLAQGCAKQISVRKNVTPTISRELAWIRGKIARMSYEEKRGWFCMVSIPDRRLSDDTAVFLRTNHIRGVILFGLNIENEKQLRQLTSDLRAKVDSNIIIAIDQEGGVVTRIPWEEFARVSEEMIGRKDQLVYAYTVFYKRACYLASLGINMVLAPVADVPDSAGSYMFSRCFGTNAEDVARFVDISVKAQRDAGLISVLKHFPGHGKTSTDSHKKFPVINMDYRDTMKELLPFLRGISAGAETVMVGHIINTNVDPVLPASLSFNYVRMLEGHGFRGVVITDDLSMAGGLRRTIGWGINIITGTKDDIAWMMKKMKPMDAYLERILWMVFFRGKEKSDLLRANQP